MKKFGFFIFSILSLGLLFNHCFGYDVIIYGPNNELLFMYPVEEGTTEITLDGNWSKDGNNYTYEDGFYGTDVYFVDGYGKEQKITAVSDLYVNGQYTIGYTGEQYLDLIENQCGQFNGYTPEFEITGSVSPEYTGNVFNNFADNSLKVLLSNIPSYIQYVIMILLLFFILGIIRRFKRK